MKTLETSWDNVSDWYDNLLEQDPNSFQKNVILPNLLRIVDPKKGITIIDLACGQGYFARAFSEKGAEVVGYDISREIIDLALEHNKKTSGKAKFHVSPANSIPFIQNNSVDVVTIILALQNIENIQGVFAECARVLKPGGKVVFVINHPAFRIPKNSSWGTAKAEDGKKEKKRDGKIVDALSMYRRVNSYMSNDQIKIDMTPGEKNQDKKKFTVSFHRPLQSYFKILSKNNLAVTRLEEWISHKKSQAGPHSAEEDRVRKEIPMFLCVEAVK
ncbi:MAG: hypothetical protein RL536_241 [Candidatus Parcubacteria bacterium]|jgi:SAM-dependent methyltransferase